MVSNIRNQEKNSSIPICSPLMTPIFKKNTRLKHKLRRFGKLNRIILARHPKTTMRKANDSPIVSPQNILGDWSLKTSRKPQVMALVLIHFPQKYTKPKNKLLS